MTKHHLRLVLLLTLLSTSLGRADEPLDATRNRAETIRANYAKFEHRIAMRDGAKLFTAVYMPTDRTKAYPILMVRTPYSVGPYGADRYPTRLGPSAEFEQEGFIFVFQDVRGRNLSEGRFVNMRPHIEGKQGNQVDESSDTHDTISWLLENVSGHNGKVGQWGISYPGFYTSAGAIDSHPALVAVSPQAPIADWFWDDMHHHGAFILPLAFNFFSSFGVSRPEPTTARPDSFDFGTRDGYQFFLDLGPLSNVNRRHFHDEIQFWNEMAAHPNYDEFWQSRNSYESPAPFQPGEPTRVRLKLQDVLHTFKRGHRIMVHVQSSWFPFVDRNPQSWVPNIFEATEKDFIKVTNRVYRSREFPSRIRIGTLP
jgi:hypothetical protein